MFAQDCFGPPLRKAALKLILAAVSAKFASRSPANLDLRVECADAHARAKKRFDQAGPVNNFQRRRLESGPASLAMRRKPAFHDARLDAMAKKFAGREQSRRTGPHDQDGRRGCGLADSGCAAMTRRLLGRRLG